MIIVCCAAAAAASEERREGKGRMRNDQRRRNRLEEEEGEPLISFAAWSRSCIQLIIIIYYFNRSPPTVHSACLPACLSAVAFVRTLHATVWTLFLLIAVTTDGRTIQHIHSLIVPHRFNSRCSSD